MIKNYKGILSTVLAASMVMSLTACSSIANSDTTKYPLVRGLTDQELKDYYAESLNYDTVINRNVEVHETTYELQDVSESKAQTLKELQSKTELLLGQDSYVVTEDNLNLLTPDSYEYIKALVDDYVLTNGTVTNIKGALGYYFVDVTYDVAAQNPGKFNQFTSLIGIDGVFKEDYLGNIDIDQAYLTTCAFRLNNYYLNNQIIKNAEFDTATNLFTIKNEAPVVVKPSNDYTVTIDTTPQTEEVTEETTTEEVTDTENTESTEATENTETTENAEATETTDAEAATENSETSEESEGVSIDDIQEVTLDDAFADLDVEEDNYSVIPANRRCQLDIDLINSVAGSSVRPGAYMPELDVVYNIPEKQGTISGFGIYPSGLSGLKLFGFDRAQLSGTLKLRYVYKDAADGSGKIVNQNVYCTDLEINNGVNVSSQNVLIPEFVESEISQLIERSDRALIDYDISALMSGHIYQDMGVTVLRGYQNNATSFTSYMSTLRQVLARDVENNSYLIEVETTSVEGAQDADSNGTYKDKYYMVIQQQGDEFVITDKVRMSRTVKKEAPINPDNIITKRLTSLNLAGEIPEDSKTEIKSLILALYNAGTNKLLSNGPHTLVINGEEVVLDKGIQDCFQTDVNLLSTEERSYMITQLVNQLVAHGNDRTAIHRGTITEWIGGYEDQAEFVTEELITYDGLDEAHYMQVYYLVSKLNDVWMIDQRTIIDEYDISGADVTAVLERMN